MLNSEIGFGGLRVGARWLRLVVAAVFGQNFPAEYCKIVLAAMKPVVRGCGRSSWCRLIRWREVRGAPGPEAHPAVYLIDF